MHVSEDNFFDEFKAYLKDEWIHKLEKDLKGHSYEHLIWKSHHGPAIEPFYTLEEVAKGSLPAHSPGSPPYFRGTKESSNHWLIREGIWPNKNIKSTRKDVLSAIENGAGSLKLKINATANGFDGLPLRTTEQLIELLVGIDLAQHGLSFESGLNSPFYLRMLGNYIEDQGLQETAAWGTIDYNPIGEYLKTGQKSFDLNNDFKACADLLAFNRSALPYYKSIQIDFNLFHNAGAGAATELALGLSLLSEYVQQLEERGEKAEELLPYIFLQVPIGGHYFVEIAKIRALRWLWASFCDALSLEVKPPYIIGNTSQHNKSVYDPQVNMLRSTSEAMAGAIAGLDEMEILPFDSTFRKPDQFSRRIARNVHHLMREESFMGEVIDPSAGSYYIDTLTEELAKEAWSQFKKIEASGGLIQYFESGALREDLLSVRKKREERLAHRKEVYIGSNAYPNPKDKIYDILKAEEQSQKVLEDASPADLFSARDVHAYASYQNDAAAVTQKPVETYVAMEAFEQLRAEVDLRRKSGGKIPSFFLIPVGNPAMRTARATFCQNILESGGFDIHNTAPFEHMSDAVESYQKHQSDYVIFCSSDDAYKDSIKAFHQHIKQTSLRPALIIAGKAGEREEDYMDLGVESYLFAGMNQFDFLNNILKETV